jgi:hypothetical protein
VLKLFEILKDPNANYRDPNMQPEYIKIRKLPISFDLNTQLGRGMAGGQAFLAFRVYIRRKKE